MAYTIRVAINRSAYGQPNLTIDDTPPGATGGLWIPEGGLKNPEWDLRRTYAPDSRWQPGRRLLAVVRDASALPFTVYAQAPTTSGLQILKTAVDDALAQFDFTVSVTVAGIVKTYRCEPSYVKWTDPDPGMVSAHMERGTVSIPVN